MRRNTSQISVALVACFAAFAFADGDTNLTFTDLAEFNSNLTGQTIAADTSFALLPPLMGGLGNDFFAVGGDTPQAFGSFNFVDGAPFVGNPGIFENRTGVVNFPPTDFSNGEPSVGILVYENPHFVINIDRSNGELEGFSFEYAGPSDSTAKLLDEDGNTLEEILLPASDPIAGFGGIPADFGWLNCTGLEVATIQICVEDGIEDEGSGSRIIRFNEFNFSFVDSFETPEPTCLDLIQGVIDELGVIRELASPTDQQFIDLAIYDLIAAQDPIFFDTPDLLSDYGTGFFDNVFWATYFLEYVYEDDLVEGSLIAIQDVLSCVVENEIEFALENPEASSNLIAYAEYFEAFADAYAEEGLYLQAVLLHFYAWLFSNFA